MYKILQTFLSTNLYIENESKNKAETSKSMYQSNVVRQDERNITLLVSIYTVVELSSGPHRKVG